MLVDNNPHGGDSSPFSDHAAAPASASATKKDRRRKITTTLCYCIAYLSLGIVISLLGPTLLDLSNNTGTSLDTMGYLFTARGIGMMLGSILGGLVFDSSAGSRYGNIVISGSTFAQTAVLIVIPLATGFWMLLGLFFALGLGYGMLDNGVNVLLGWLWFGEAPEVWFQLVHCCFGVGGLAAPLIIGEMIKRLRSAFGIDSSNNNNDLSNIGLTAGGRMPLNIVYWILAALVLLSGVPTLFPKSPVSPKLLPKAKSEEAQQPQQQQQEQKEEEEEEINANNNNTTTTTTNSKEVIHAEDIEIQTVPLESEDEDDDDKRNMNGNDPNDKTKVKKKKKKLDNNKINRLKQLLFSDADDLRRKIYFCLIAAFLLIYIGCEVGYAGWIFTYAVTPEGEAVSGRSGHHKMVASVAAAAAAAKGAWRLATTPYAIANTNTATNTNTNTSGIMDEQEAFLLTSGFWASFTIGKVLAVPISAYWLSNAQMLAVDLIGSLVSAIVLIASTFFSSYGNTERIVLWIGTLMFGLFLASCYASVVALPASSTIHHRFRQDHELLCLWCLRR